MAKILDKIPTCICCGSEKRKILEFESQLVHLDPSMKVVKCKCGLIHIFPFYNIEYTSTMYDELHNRWGSLYRNGEPEDYEKVRLDRITKYFHKKELNLLEIGSGIGCFLNYAKNIGWRAVGIEISPKAVEFARKKFGLDEIYCGDFLNMDLGYNRFNLIYCNHVLEHLPYPDKVLQKCRKLLKDDGLIVLEVPYEFRNFGYFYYKTFGSENLRKIYKNPVAHVYFFSPKTIKKILCKHGFQIIKLSCFTRQDTKTLKNVIKKILSLLTIAPSIEVWAQKK